MPLTRSEARTILLSLKGAREGLHYGKPAVFVQDEFLSRIHDKEDAVVVIVPGGIEMRDMMLEAEPELFYITDHYRNYGALLARLKALNRATLRQLMIARMAEIAAQPPRKKKKAKKPARARPVRKKPRPG